MKSFLAVFAFVLTCVSVSHSYSKQISNPYQICSENMNTTVYKNRCVQFIAKNTQKTFDLAALNFCPYLNEDQATFTCLVLSSKDSFQKSAVDFCISTNTDENRIACLVLIANRDIGPAQIDACVRVSTSDAKVTCIGQ